MNLTPQKVPLHQAEILFHSPAQPNKYIYFNQHNVYIWKKLLPRHKEASLRGDSLHIAHSIDWITEQNPRRKDSHIQCKDVIEDQQANRAVCVMDKTSQNRVSADTIACPAPWLHCGQFHYGRILFTRCCHPPGTFQLVNDQEPSPCLKSPEMSPAPRTGLSSLQLTREACLPEMAGAHLEPHGSW